MQDCHLTTWWQQHSADGDWMWLSEAAFELENKVVRPNSTLNGVYVKRERVTIHNNE